MPNNNPLAISQNSSHHGVLSGGILSVNAGDNAKFDVSDGLAQFAVTQSATAKRFSFSGLTAQTVTNLATDSASFIFLQSDGTLRQQTAPPTASDYRDYIYLGQLGHSNNTSVANAVPTPQLALDPAQQFQDLASSIGTINSGVALTPNGANLSLDLTGGSLFSVGAGFAVDTDTPHTVTIASDTAITIRMRGVSAGTGTTTTLDVGNYDNAGTITALANNRYQNFRCYIIPGTGNVVIQYGQNFYTQLSAAQDAIPTESFTLRDNLAGSAILLGIITAKSNGTDLSDTADAEFLYATKFGDTSALTGGGGGSGVTDHGALTGLADDDHTQYHNDTRGDARYYTQAQVDSGLSGKSDTGHTHTLSDITDSGALAALDTISATELDAGAVTNAKLADVATATIKGRTTAGTGDVEDLTATQARALLNVEDGATADQSGAEIKAAYEAELNAFTDAQFTKLAGIETGATADQTGAQIKVAYEAEADTNAFTDADHTKLDGIETAATADQTGAQIKVAYEAEANTNAFTDAEQSKLSGIEAGAEVNDVTSVNGATGAVVVPLQLTFVNYPPATPYNNMPAARSLAFQSGMMHLVDTSRFTEARLFVLRGGNASQASAIMSLEYATSFTLNLVNWSAAGTSAIECDITDDNTGTDSGWVSLAAGAIGSSIYLGLTTTNGNGVQDPKFIVVTVQLR